MSTTTDFGIISVISPKSKVLLEYYWPGPKRPPNRSIHFFGYYMKVVRSEAIDLPILGVANEMKQIVLIVLWSGKLKDFLF